MNDNVNDTPNPRQALYQFLIATLHHSSSQSIPQYKNPLSGIDNQRCPLILRHSLSKENPLLQYRVQLQCCLPSLYESNASSYMVTLILFFNLYGNCFCINLTAAGKLILHFYFIGFICRQGTRISNMKRYIFLLVVANYSNTACQRFFLHC